MLLVNCDTCENAWADAVKQTSTPVENGGKAKDGTKIRHYNTLLFQILNEHQAREWRHDYLESNPFRAACIAADSTVAFRAGFRNEAGYRGVCVSAETSGIAAGFA